MSPVNVGTSAISATFEEIDRIVAEKCEGILVGDARNCIGCRACVKACRKRGGSLLAGRWTEFGTVRIAPACRVCEHPRCLAACPQRAIRKESGRVLIDDEMCVKCMRCVRMCPFGLIHATVTCASGANSSAPWEPGKPGGGRLPKEISKCDRCAGRGSPACVHECPTGALRFIDQATFRALVEPWRVRIQEAAGGRECPVPGREVALCRFP